MNKGCTSLYSGTQLSIEKTNPFRITFIGNSFNDFSETVCLKCIDKIGKYESTRDNIVINQSSKCSTSLRLKDDIEINENMEYAHTSHVGSWE